MRIKDDTIILLGLNPAMVIAAFIADEVCKKYGEELVITSAVDGTHSRTSLHYAGSAFDMRIRFFSETEKIKVHKELSERLKRHFDVVLESDHIHLEYHPKCRKE